MKLGRNDKCRCGSDRKYKHCCCTQDSKLPLLGAALTQVPPIANPMGRLFDLAWERIELFHENKVKIVSKEFVKNLVAPATQSYFNFLTKFGFNIKGMDIEQFDLSRFADYIFHYHYFYTSHLSEEERSEKEKDDEYLNRLTAEIGWLAYINEEGAMKIKSVTSLKSPEILNFSNLYNRLIATHNMMLLKIESASKAQTLAGMFQIAFFTAKGIINLIAEGNIVSAVTLWRNLFEMECTIAVLSKEGDRAVKQYLKHQEFDTYEYDDKIKAKLKVEAKKYNEKDAHRFAKYGWLLECSSFDKEIHTLTFSKGVLVLAGHEKRYAAYSEASKVTHISPKVLKIPIEKYYYFLMGQLCDSTTHLANLFARLLQHNNLLNDVDLKNYIDWTQELHNKILETDTILHEKEKQLNKL